MLILLFTFLEFQTTVGLGGHSPASAAAHEGSNFGGAGHGINPPTD